MQKIVNNGYVAGGGHCLLKKQKKKTPVLGIDRGRVSFPADLIC